MRYEAAYARQSVEKKNSLSIRGQLDLCIQTARNPALQLYSDQGYSGKNTDRPDFQRLLKDIRENKISKLYVYRLDRFSRSIADFGQLWNVLQEHGVEFVSVTESFDTSTPMGRAMLHIIMVFAQLERETTAERVRDNYVSRAALGAWPGGPAPYGFRIGRAPGREGRDTPTLAVQPEQARVVQRIFEEYAGEEVSLKALAARLNRDGIPAPRRDVWDSVSLSRLLHNPVYVRADALVRHYYAARGVKILSDETLFNGENGLLLFGKRNANDRKYTNIQEHTLTVLNSAGFVSPELFLQCQDRLSHNAQIKNAGRGKHSWLSGLMKCAKCGYSISVQKDAPGNRRLYCSGKYNLARCDAGVRVSVDELEAALAMEIGKLLEECPAEPISPDETEETAGRLAEIDRRADRLTDAFANDEAMDRTYLHRALARLEKERQAIIAARKREKKRPWPREKIVFDRLTPEEKKIVAARFIDRIEIGEREAEVLWNI